MPFGDYPDERILINDGTVWAGRSEVRKPPADAAQTVKEIRAALFKDGFETSERLLNGKLLVPRPEHLDFQPIGYLHLCYGEQGRGGKLKDYRRILSLNDAVAVSEFTTEDGNQIRQEVIASHPADVIAIRVESRNGRRLSVAVGLDRFKYFQTGVLDDRTLTMSGVALVDGKFVGTAWQAGSFSGLCARGGFDLDLTWKDGRPVRLTVSSKAGEEFRFKSSGGIRGLQRMPPLKAPAAPSVDSIPASQLTHQPAKQRREEFAP